MANWDTFANLTSPQEIYLTTEFSYVIFDLCLAFLLTVTLMFRVAYLRGKYKINPPKVLSEDFIEFECAQRVYQNTLETSIYFILNIIIGGIRHPIIAAIFGLLFVLGRLAYAIGYTIEPKFRMPGFITTITSLFLLFGTAVSTAIGLVMM